MTFKWISFYLLLVSTLACLVTSNAYGLNINDHYTDSISEQFSTKEAQEHLSSEQILNSYLNGEFNQIENNVANFGINATPHWLAISIRNPEQFTIERQLTVSNAWLDKIEFYFYSPNDKYHKLVRGDHLPFSQRGNNQRFFNIDYGFPPGITHLLIRVESIDPMLVPIYFQDENESVAHQRFDSYSYGFLYGAIFCLLAYNLMLFIGLRNVSYFYYSLFLLSFMILNMAYTGHGYQWLWPNSIQWQQLANPLLMGIFNLFGLLFALHFLSIKRLSLLLYRSVLSLCAIFLLPLIIILAMGEQAIALYIAFVFMLLFSILMLILGMFAIKRGNSNGKLFLLASMTSMLGTASTGITVLGLIPYTTLSYRASEAGMLVDMTLLAFALARQFRHIENEKLHAQYMAKLDPLTGLNNRRAFYELMPQLWQQSQPKQGLSLAMIDIDYFKQINDRFGHSCGDLVLAKVGSMLMQQLRQKDVAVRWGGEEFLLVFYNTKLADAIIIVNEFAAQIQQYPFAKGDETFNITISAGVAYGTSNQCTLGQLIDKADELLYLAKHEGRNQLRF
ncbi:sensor domain-containing diguanylate cyclase [Shewanella psychrotolerans]|uniref:sensor domain-containing diguanylate cyclase n=1 Tax=Shewanella psychrotolerans TaxID=2864206 RepID=UPI001C655006|nr:diguanylate cyclase [Shewanella psychrotolerans]QYK02108.1 sensor domain-containing diguanylate cyclase [Shewanella psychrotolerans]